MEFTRSERKSREFAIGNLEAFRIPAGVVTSLDGGPVDVVVAEISSMMVRTLVRGLPRQFMVMNLNMRCSMRFHFDVPGGSDTP